MTIPAEISTIFFIMYCPSRVGTNGKELNVSVGKRTSGVIVPIICAKSKNKVVLKNMPEINPSPIKVSSKARRIIDTSGLTVSKLSIEIVLVASCIAALAPGKNLRTPNHRKTMPKLHRKSVVPYFDIHSVIDVSVR